MSYYSSEDLPIVSFVIPGFNAEKSLFRCLNSIIEQKYPKEKIEIIYVDNNSSDESLLIASQFNCKVLQEKTQGRSYARNTGAREAKGEFIAFIDSDCYLDDEWTIHLVRKLQLHNIGGGQGKIIPSLVDGRHLLNKYRYTSIKNGTGGTFVLLSLMVKESPMVNSCACMYRKEAFEFVHGFDVNLERHEDIDLSRRVCISGWDLISSSQSIANVMFHGDGWLDYFKRSFADGYYKNLYVDKWKKYSFIENEESVNPVSKKFLQNPKKNFKDFYPWLAIKYAVLDLINLFLRLQPFLAIKILNDILKILGRLASLNIKYRGPRLVLSTHKNFPQKRSLKIEGKEYQISKNFRFIFLDERFYLFDVKANQFVDPQLCHYRDIRNQLLGDKDIQSSKYEAHDLQQLGVISLN
ncbi:MAG: hypothetical protein OHK0056_00660 [Bacteriovoracaceae bacterium]